MMKQLFLSSTLIACILLSCNSPKTENNGPQTFHIDLNATNDEADKLCKRMEMRLLPLESNEHSIFNDVSAKMHVKGNMMIVEDPSQNGHIFVFDNQGNFIRHWNKTGQGDEEYTRNLSMTTTDDKIYIQDHTRIQVYDYSGNHICSIPNKRDRGTQIEVAGDKVYVRKGYMNENQLHVMDENGTVLSEHLPSREVTRNFMIPLTNYFSMGSYDGGVYLSNPLDLNIYLMKDTVQTLAKLDFGTMNLPADFFDGDTQTVERNMHEARAYKGEKDTRHIIFIDNLVVTDDWITFTPATFDFRVVFCDRNTLETFTNKNFKFPYSVFFKKYNAPLGFNKQTQEFYQLVNAMEVKEIVEEAQANGDMDKYPFLKNLDVESINEDTNAFVLFFKIK